MIVSINENNSDSYLNLFTDAYRFLKAIDAKEGTNYVDPNKERFASLAEYYGHMADLFDTFAYQYVMTPLDEEPFRIDLNKREIKVPSSFSACASIQTDLLAETIVFTVDRYFDYMDLATTEIFVQWITPDGTHGATRVEMIDRTQGDILKFAWPLNNLITKTPGKVKFSVRFFRLDTASDAIVYSLNTSDAEITIKPALQPNGPSIVERPVGDNSFKKAIINSYYSDEGIPQPITPNYQEPGSDITINPENLEILEEDDNNIINNVKVVGLKDDSVTLYAQAIVPDAGEITYEWYFKPVDAEVAHPCAAFPGEDGETAPFGVSEDAYIAVSEEDAKVKVPHVRYYVKKENSYELYTGSFPATETLYTRFAAYTVAEDVDITGKYHVRAYNNVSTNNGVIRSATYAASSDCLLPPPKDVVINENLHDGVILKDDKADLTLTLAADEYNPAITYEWRSSAVSAEAALDKETEVVTTTTDAAFTATTPGWYSARAIATLNRKVKDLFSNVCKVTHKPLPPVVAFQGNETVYIEGDNSVSLTIEASIANADNIATELLSDKIHYIWQIRPINATDSNSWINVVEGDAGISGFDTDTLVIDKNLPYAGANFRCLVVNELNGAKAVFDHSGSYDGKLDIGEFKDEIPYVFANDKAYTYTVLNMD